MAWTDEKKAQAVKLYTEANPTPETSVEIVKEVAEALGETTNGVRMILSKAEVYVKQAAGATKSSGSAKSDEDKPKRVSKADSIQALSQLIESEGITPDAEILDKLTGKQAVYFTELLKKFL
jgi:transposase-like protein